MEGYFTFQWGGGGVFQMGGFIFKCVCVCVWGGGFPLGVSVLMGRGGGSFEKHCWMGGAHLK